ncbi:MAG: WD40/YVTN/BNR-like repeat-containing protein [Candidatus Thorarchaeota archaeon]
MKPLLIGAIVLLVIVSGCTTPEDTLPTYDNWTNQTGNETPPDDQNGQPSYPGLDVLKQHLRDEGSSCTEDWRVPMTDKSLVVAPSDPDTIYIGVRYTGVYRSTDGGETWEKIVNGLLTYFDTNNPEVICYEVGKMVVDPTNSQRVLMAPVDINYGTVNDPYTETSGVWESVNGGDSWQQIVHGDMNAGGTGALAIDPNDRYTIYFGSGYGTASYSEADPNKKFSTIGVLYKTTSAGEEWEELPTGVITGNETGTQGMRVFINPDNSNELLLMTQSHDHKYYEDSSYDEIAIDEQLGILRSTDGGQTWASILESIPQGYRTLFDGDVSTRNFDHIFIKPELFGKFGDLEIKTFYSVDGGETFEETGIYIRLAKYDPHDETGNHMFGYSPYENGKNIAESNDAGATWQALGIPEEVLNFEVQIEDFEWDPVNPDTVYMSGQGGYVWKSTNAGQSWTRILSFDTLPE